MGRKERRDLERKGVSKETAKKVDALNTPCTILEAIQLAEGVVEDALTTYKANTVPLTVSHTLHIQVMKNLLISKGLITEEEFMKLYMEEAEHYKAEQLRFQEEERKAEGESQDSEPQEESKEV